MRQSRGNSWPSLRAFILVSSSSLLIQEGNFSSYVFKFLIRWINPLLIKGYKFDLNIKDMFRPLKKDDATLRANILTE